MTLADEMAQIVTMGPVIKDILDENVEGSERGSVQAASETQLSAMPWECSALS